MKKMLFIILAMPFLFGCGKELLDSVGPIEVEASNWSMTEPSYASQCVLGVCDEQISFPTPTEDYCITMINETYARIFNCETNNTISVQDVSDGRISLAAPIVTASLKEG